MENSLIKGLEEAWDYFDELASNNQTWELAASNRLRGIEEVYSKWGGDEDWRLKGAQLTCKLEDLDTNKVYEVSTCMEICKLCDEVGYSTNDYPTITVLKEVLNGGSKCQSMLSTPSKTF